MRPGTSFFSTPKPRGFWESNSKSRVHLTGYPPGAGNGLPDIRPSRRIAERAGAHPATLPLSDGADPRRGRFAAAGDGSDHSALRTPGRPAQGHLGRRAFLRPRNCLGGGLYLSGAGRYEIAFDLPGLYLREGLELVLDLGQVGDVAEVILNGRAAGVCWMQPYKLAITPAARPGPNQLSVMVANQLMNHVAGMDHGWTQIYADQRSRNPSRGFRAGVTSCAGWLIRWKPGS